MATTITLQYEQDGVVANAKVFLYRKISETYTQIDDGTWTTGVDGLIDLSDLVSGATYYAVFVDPLKLKDTRVLRFIP